MTLIAHVPRHQLQACSSVCRPSLPRLQLATPPPMPDERLVQPGSWRPQCCGGTGACLQGASSLLVFTVNPTPSHARLETPASLTARTMLALEVANRTCGMAFTRFLTWM